jgi:hypothetical protein
MSIRGIPITTAMDPILAADREEEPFAVINAIIQGVAENNLNLQTIENSLRKNCCRTYLVAKSPEGHLKGVPIVLPGDSHVKKYYLVISTQDKQEALKSMLKESGSYATNFNKLKDTGFINAAEG